MRRKVRSWNKMMKLCIESWNKRSIRGAPDYVGQCKLETHHCAYRGTTIPWPLEWPNTHFHMLIGPSYSSPTACSYTQLDDHLAVELHPCRNRMHMCWPRIAWKSPRVATLDLKAISVAAERKPSMCPLSKWMGGISSEDWTMGEKWCQNALQISDSTLPNRGSCTLLLHWLVLASIWSFESCLDPLTRLLHWPHDPGIQFVAGQNSISIVWPTIDLLWAAASLGEGERHDLLVFC